jgi:hypothetical protein
MQLWADAFSGFAKASKGAADKKEWTEPWRTPVDIYNRWLNISKEMFGEYWERAPWGIGQQTSVRVMAGMQIYNKLYEFWASAVQLLSGARPEGKGIQETYQGFYESWLKNYNELLNSFFKVSLFEPPMWTPAAAMELPQMYANNLSKFVGPWMEAMHNLPGKMAEAVQKGPQGYPELYRLWLQAYEQTWGRVLRMPPLGLTRETIERIQRGTKALIDHFTAMSDFSSALQREGVKAMQKVATRLEDMYNMGQAPKTFKEFYTLWWTTNEETIYELFKTEEFSHLLGRVTDATMDVRKRYDDIMEEYLKMLPIPTRSEMNDLYKTVYQLKKEVRRNTKQSKDLAEEIRTRGAASIKEKS